jgi:hypothetical protein
MIGMYCRANHRTTGTLCPICLQLRDYAEKRIHHCVFGPEKPVCSACPVHCYRPGMRAQIREVMRYAGPRMLLHHPLAAIRHLLHKLRPVPGAASRH